MVKSIEDTIASRIIRASNFTALFKNHHNKVSNICSIEACSLCTLTTDIPCIV